MISNPLQNTLTHLGLAKNALTKLCHQTPQTSSIIAGSYFIKSWKGVHDSQNLHIFYNYNTSSFWAVLQGQTDFEVIPSMKDGFEMITVPLLASKMVQDKIINHQYPFSSTMSSVSFFQKEIRYPIIKKTSNGHTIQLNCAGLLGGGAKVSRNRIGVVEVSKQSKVNKQSEVFFQVKKYLLSRYKILVTNKEDTKDEKFVEKLAEKICGITSFDQASSVEKHLNEFIDLYEEEYIDEIVLDIAGKSMKEGRPQLDDYIKNFSSGGLCMELLRKGYYANERAKGGVSQLISEKILAKLGEETKTLLTKLGQKREGDEDILHKPVIFEQLFAMLEMRENINSFLKPLSKIKVKKILSFVKDQLKIETEDQQEIITEFCCSDKSEEIFLDITSRLLTLGTRAFSSSPERSPIKSPLKLQVSQSGLLQPIKFESSPFNLPNTPQNLKASHSERNSRVFEESPESKKTDSKRSSNQIPYLSRLRLNVLNELNLLDHELVTLVELHNMLKLDNTENSEAKGSTHNSKNHKLDDVKSLIMSVVRGYRENESNLDSTELDSLLPVAFIQDPKIFKAFLQVFLEDLANDILFEVKKVRMLSFILISAMRNPDFKEYCQVDDLIQCLKILKPKIEDLSITSENINIQEAMAALNDILFLMGYIGAKGVKGDYLEMVKELTKYMQTHGLEKTFNSLTGKAKDPSLEIKREYAVEAFKRIEGTSFEEWEKNFQNVLQVGNIAINIGKGIFLSDLSSICEALLQIKDLLDKACAHRIQCWYDHVNELRYLAHERIEKIVKELFGMKQRSYNKKYSFFAAEFLLTVIAQPTRKIREKKMAAQALWFLTNGFDYKMFQSQRYLFKSRTYSFDKDICLFVLQSLLSIAQKAEIDFSIFIRKLVETPFRPEKMENSKIEANAPVKPAEKPNEENPGKRFYVKILMEKKPRLYALAKIQERSEKALVKPSILVDFRGIDKEKDCEESFVKKLREKVDNLKSTSIGEPIRELMALDAKTASKKTFSEAVNNIVFHKGEFKPEQEKSARNQFRSAVNAKAKEINEVNTSELLEVLEEFLVNPTKTVLLIQGDAGAGKTLLLRLFEARLWKKYNMLSKADSKNRNRLPLRIALSEVRSFDKAVDEFLMQHGCDAEAVVDIKKEPAAILFDGYDEINQYINLYNLNKLDTWRDVKVIFTSRKENLTSLKEDYLLCFTPGTDKQKVLSYSIQPVNEDQIRKYFNAQVSENQAQIKKLEDKLKILNGNDSADVTISKTIEREVAWLEKFPTSEHYNCICEISNTLEDHLPEIQELQEEIEKYKDNGVEVFQLTQVFEKQITELQKLTDKANIEALAKKLGSDLIEELKQIEKAVDSCLESLEGEIDANNRSNQVIKARIKRIKGLTDLKRISHIAKKVAQQTEKSADETLTNLKNVAWVETAKSHLKYLENRTSAQGIKSAYSPEELQKIKDFNKKIKIPSRADQEIILIDITDAEAYLNKILEHPDLDKFQSKFAKIYEKVDECSTLENELKSLLKGEEQELLKEENSKTEEKSKPEGELKQAEQKKAEGELKAEGEPKPERNSKPEEKPNLEGEPNPEKESQKELKSEEESKPEEENKTEEKIKTDRELKSEGESKPEGDLEPEDKSHSEAESKGEEESKLEEEKRPEDKLQLEEKPNLEGESNPEKESQKELKSEEESKPEDKPQSEGDVQPPQDQTGEAKSVIKRELDFCNIKDKINKMKDLVVQIREMIQELKLFEADRHVRFVKYDNSINELRGMTDEERGMTDSEMYDIMGKVQTLDSTIRCALNMPTEAGYSIRYLEIVKDHANIVLYHNHAGSIIQKLKQKIDEITESLSSVKGHQSDHSEGSEVIQILQKQITSLKAMPTSQDIQRVIQKLDDITNEIKAVENESKAVKDVVTDEAVMVKTLVKQIKDLKKFTDSDNLEFIIQKFKDIITSPFMLKMLLDTLKKFPKSTANRSELYRLFSTIHFEREKDKLLQVEKIPPKFNVIDSFYQYSKDLAVNMFIKKLTSLQAKSNGYKVKGVVETEKKNQWSRFFDETELITKLAKRGAQIIEDDGVVRFIHKSILEYFAARQFYDEIVDYNPENQEEAFDPCLNKGPVIDNETAVYLFIKDIADTDAVKNDKDLTIFDKKLLETLNSPVLQKEYGNEFNKNYMYPNLFLIILMRKNLTKKLVGQKEDSIASVMINSVLKWMFTETSDNTRKFVDMLQKIKILDGEIYVNMNHLLKIYYHHASKQDGPQFKDRFITAKRNIQQIKIGINPDGFESQASFIVKDGALAQATDAIQYCWVLDAKLFIHDSLDHIVILKSGNKCLAVDTAKDTTTSKPGDFVSNYAVAEKETPWEVRECKWIMKMNQHEKYRFELNSLTDSTKVLYGSFQQNLEEYSIVFADLCETDIHFGSIGDISYQCRTCKITNGQILCKNCMEKCHKGHDIFEYGRSGGYCDCRFLGCCEIVVGCTVKFPQGYRNPVMFKCTQCPNDKRKILCLACKKHHEGEHQNFEKVLDAEGCDCDCPSTKTRVIAHAQDGNFLDDRGDNENNDNEGVDTESDADR